MPANNDCCCFCFSSKSGVIIIGVLAVISFFVTLMETIAYQDIYWVFLPLTISYFIVTMNFIRLMTTHGTVNDVITRYRLFYSYLVNVVILCNVWSLICRLVWPQAYLEEICNHDDKCIDDQKDLNTVPVIIALQFPNILIQAYFCSVIKLYADKGRQERNQTRERQQIINQANRP